MSSNGDITDRGTKLTFRLDLLWIRATLILDISEQTPLVTRLRHINRKAINFSFATLCDWTPQRYCVLIKRKKPERQSPDVVMFSRRWSHRHLSVFGLCPKLDHHPAPSHPPVLAISRGYKGSSCIWPTIMFCIDPNFNRTDAIPSSDLPYCHYGDGGWLPSE